MNSKTIYTWLTGSIIISVVLIICSTAPAANPTFTNDAYGYPQWDDGYGNKYVLWGIESDQWQCQIGNGNIFHEHCDACNYINANCIFIPVTWKMIESTQDNYSSWYLQLYIDQAEAHGLKVILLWTGADNAAVCMDFTPDYIMNDTVTYTRITGLDNSSELCPSDPDTRGREAAAFAWMMNWLKTYNPQKANIVMGVSVGNELDYMGCLDGYYWKSATEDHSRRCTCGNCNAQYQAGEDKVDFMSRMFGNYIKAIIDAGMENYEIPVYTPMSSNNWWSGWRYAEQPSRWKSIINRENHLVCPSTAETSSASVFITNEMDYFLNTQIPGNRIFVDGIDTGWTKNQSHIELAPWYSILWYGGLGAGYWDNPYLSVRNDETLRTKLRKSWGPLLGIQHWLARYKAAGTDKKFFWEYGQTHTSQSLAHYSIDQVSTDQDYGICFELDPNTITFTGTTYGGPYTVTVSHNDGWDGYLFERGYYDRTTGAWVKYSNISPTINGNNATITVSNDSGEFAKSVYRYIFAGIPGDINEDKKVNVSDLAIMLQHWLTGVDN